MSARRWSINLWYCTASLAADRAFASTLSDFDALMEKNRKFKILGNSFLILLIPYGTFKHAFVILEKKYIEC